VELKPKPQPKKASRSDATLSSPAPSLAKCRLGVLRPCYSRILRKRTWRFEPDILITSEDDPRPAVVVEAKTYLIDLERTEADLKRYMVGMLCPVGLLIIFGCSGIL